MLTPPPSLDPAVRASPLPLYRFECWFQVPCAPKTFALAPAPLFTGCCTSFTSIEQTLRADNALCHFSRLEPPARRASEASGPGPSRIGPGRQEQPRL